MVFFPKEAPWLPSMMQEMLSFPMGIHDDQVDAIAWIGQMLSIFTPAILAKEDKKPSWKDNLDALSRSKLARSNSAMGA